MWSTWAVKELVYKVLGDENDHLVDQFSTQFLEAVEYSAMLTDVFRGSPPYSNEPLKKLAAAGSSYFDSVYYQMTALHKVQTKKSQHLPAPNEPLVELYDIILDRASPSSELYEHKASLLTRHWNNKGNSMESLALIPLESRIPCSLTPPKVHFADQCSYELLHLRCENTYVTDLWINMGTPFPIPLRGKTPEKKPLTVWNTHVMTSEAKFHLVSTHTL